MSRERWTAVDRYVTDLLIPPDPALDAALKASAEANLPQISVTPPQGKLLMLLAKLTGAKRILEIGTLGGYSTIWLARALPSDGRLLSLEIDPEHAAIARTNLARAGVDRLVEVLVGRALETLPRLVAEARGPFDLVFIDANKEDTAEYFAWALKLSRPGTVIIVDNVVRDGAVVEKDSTDQSVLGIRRFNEALAKEPRVMATEIQTVGSKGYDGFALALVRE
jgi:predicted O-methyltransferase YrrM